MLRNEVHRAKFLGPVFEIWEPWHPFLGNPEKQISYSCILDYTDSDSDDCLIFRVAIYLFIIWINWIMATLTLKMLCWCWKFITTHISHNYLRPSLLKTKIIFIIRNENYIFNVFQKLSYLKQKLLKQSKTTKSIQWYLNLLIYW